MGFDKDSVPRKPTLAARQVISRTPLTPKIASTGSNRPLATPSAASHHYPNSNSNNTSPFAHTVTVSTPYARRAAGPASSFTTAGGSHHPSARDDLASPAGSPFPNSITPRSGSRQSRVDHTTPNGSPLPHGERHASIASASPLSNNSADSKFFYASDAKSSTPNLQKQPSPPPMQRASTFFYANQSHQQSHPPPQQSQQHTPSPTASNTNLPGKFVYANNIHDRPHPTPLKGFGGASTSSSPALGPPKLASGRSTPHGATTPTSGGYVPPHQRPLSPVRAATTSPYPLQKSGTFPISARSPALPPAASPTTASTPSASTATSTSSRLDGLQRQRSSGGTTGTSMSNNGGHSRNGSLTIAEAAAVNRLLHSSQPTSEASTPSSAHFAPSPQMPSSPLSATSSNGSATVHGPGMPTGIDAIIALPDELGAAFSEDGGSRRNSGRLTDGMQSPTNQPGSPVPGQGDDLVLNARRDRKVQDLEITNASLEAINRSLERQLRKQKNEIRNFRRMSRSGRLSMAPSNRITSSSTVEGPLLDQDQLLSGFSDDDDDGEGGLGGGEGLDSFDEQDSSDDLDASPAEEEDDSEDLSSPGSPTSDTSSPALTSKKRRRKREEKRIQLDLARHRELLVDSQKINQSIKRCLSWTDELIEEGRKALAFQVRVSEIQIGGRVLAEDEMTMMDDDLGESELGVAESVISKDVSVVGIPNDDRDGLKDTPKGTATVASKDISKPISKDAPKDISKDTSQDTLRDIPKDIPKETHTDVMPDIPKDLPDDAPKDSPIAVSTDIPKDTPKDLSRDSPKDDSKENVPPLTDDTSPGSKAEPPDGPRTVRFDTTDIKPPDISNLRNEHQP